MKLRLGTLRSLIRETLYTASAPKRLNLPNVEVEADNTREAGEKAAEKYFKQHGIRGIDPFSVTLTPKDGKNQNMEQVERFTVYIPGMIASGFDFFDDAEELENRYNVGIETGPGGIIEVSGAESDVRKFLEEMGIDFTDVRVRGDDEDK